MGAGGTSSDQGQGQVAESLAIFRRAFGCDEVLARTIAALSRQSQLARGSVIWPLPGRDETTLLVEGRAAEVAYGREGAVMVLLQIAPGDLYGSLMGGSTDSGTQIEALADGAGAHFATAAVLRLMESYNCVAMAVARQLAGRIEAMRRRLIDSALLSATGRIASELLRRAREAPDRTIRPVPVWAELAVEVQSTRETVSRTVSQWEKRGLLKRVDGGLLIVAPHRLEELVY